MTTAQTQLVSGGFYITRALDRPKGLGDDLLPERLLTLSPCLTQFLPDTWAIAWVRNTDEERVAAIEKLGLEPTVLPDLIRFATDAFDSGDLGWPCVWQSASAARAAVARFAPPTADFMILELGVPQDVVPELLAELTPGTQEGESGFYTRLKAGALLHEHGIPVGWELLGVETSASFHSWLCNSLQNDALSQLSIKPHDFGLLATEAHARAVMQLIADGFGAEPVPWFPGLLSRIPS